MKKCHSKGFWNGMQYFLSIGQIWPYRYKLGWLGRGLLKRKVTLIINFVQDKPEISLSHSAQTANVSKPRTSAQTPHFGVRMLITGLSNPFLKVFELTLTDPSSPVCWPIVGSQWKPLENSRIKNDKVAKWQVQISL